MLNPTWRAKVNRVIDSDTIEVWAEMWPNIRIISAIRLEGVDTPEKFRPKGKYEKELALRATEFVKELLPVESEVMLTSLDEGKYAGRVVGYLYLPDGRNLSDVLIERGFAVEYDGGTKIDWNARAKKIQRNRLKGTM